MLPAYVTVNITVTVNGKRPINTYAALPIRIQMPIVPKGSGHLAPPKRRLELNVSYSRPRSGIHTAVSIARGRVSLLKCQPKSIRALPRALQQEAWDK